MYDQTMSGKKIDKYNTIYQLTRNMKESFSTKATRYKRQGEKTKKIVV